MIPGKISKKTPLKGEITKYIPPSGELEIHDTHSTDVHRYASAKVVDANLTPENIKMGVDVLGIIGEHVGSEFWEGTQAEYDAMETHDPSAFYAITDGHPIVLVDKTVTENGEYDPADDDADGYSGVTVNVSGGVTILSGMDEPTASVGSDGDMYLRTSPAHLDSSNNSYITPGYTVKPNTKLVIDVTVKNAFSGRKYPAIFGFWQNNWSTSTTLFVRHVSVGAGNTYFAWGASYTIAEVPLEKRITITIDKDSISWTGSGESYTYQLSGTGFTAGGPFYIYTQNYNNDSNNLCPMKLYRFSIYEDDTLVHDYVPALGNNDTPCLYDEVEQAYFYNAGSDSFSYSASGSISDAHVKVNGAWQDLIGSDIGDVG